MDSRQFFDAVVEMRKYQKKYFRSGNRDRSALQYAKDYERKIDEEIKRVQLLLHEERNPRLNFNLSSHENRYS